MRSKQSACRTKSLPADPRNKTKERKLKGRVSFSSRPPVKIEFESDENEYSCSSNKKQSILLSKCEQFAHNKSGLPCCHEANKANSRTGFEVLNRDMRYPSNDLDSVNEMLMDILEEVEVENITIEDCLRDAVCLQILDEDEARDVIPSFRLDKYVSAAENDVNNNNIDGIHVNKDIDHDATESIDKFLDLFSALPTKDLAKCCKYTLGKLCQLTSYEDYEHVQKIAASVVDLRCNSPSLSSTCAFSDERTRNWSDGSSHGSYTTDDSSNETSYLSSESSENFDSLTSESETDFSFSEEKHVRSDSKCKIREALPKLVEDGILKPRQVWGILESVDQDEILQRLLKEISITSGVNELKNICRRISDQADVNSNKSFQHFSEDSDSSTIDSDYYSNNSGNESTSSLEIDKRKTSLSNLKVFKRFGTIDKASKLPFTISSARKQGKENFPMTSTPEKLAVTQTKTKTATSTWIENRDQDDLESWCLVNNLHPSTACYLRNQGFPTESEILTLTTKEMDEFYQLSWPERTKLWIAIEALKLDKMYSECRKKLTTISKSFNNLPMTQC